MDVTEGSSQGPANVSRNVAQLGQPVSDPACWTGEELSRRDDWIVKIGDEQLADLAAMADSVGKRIGGDPNGLLNLTPADLDLGRFTATLADVQRALKDGLGFVLLRGLPVDELGRLKTAIIYWALGLHLGNPLCNNPQGDMLGHVADLGKDLDNPNHRGYQTSTTMYYHVDQCDVVGLLCLQKSKSGGASKISSSVAVHNEMWRRNPELAEALTETLCWSRMGEIGPGESAWYESPLFNYVDGYLSVCAGYKHVEKGHDLAETPPLSETAKTAMFALNDIAEELHLSMDFEPGDIQLLNGHVTLHTRTGFEDWPEPERRRHLWRIWLNIPGIRPRSPYYKNWETGIWAPDELRNITLSA